MHASIKPLYWRLVDVARYVELYIAPLLWDTTDADKVQSLFTCAPLQTLGNWSFQQQQGQYGNACEGINKEPAQLALTNILPC